MNRAIWFSLVLLVQQPWSAEADPSSHSVVVRWPGEARSPGVCVGKPQWFVSVAPQGVEVEGESEVALEGAGGRKFGARVLYFDVEQRLSLLEAPAEMAGYEPVPVSEEDCPKAGAKATCASGKTLCLTTVAGKDWSYRGERFSLPLLRLRVAEEGSHCCAGTPLLGDSGELVAILTGQELEGSGEVYAIPASRIAKLVEDLAHYNRSEPVWVGLVFHAHSSAPEVIEVKPGSPASKAGLAPGDIILSMAGRETETLDDLVETVHSLPAGKAVEVRLLRGLEERQVEMLPTFAEVSR